MLLSSARPHAAVMSSRERALGSLRACAREGRCEGPMPGLDDELVDLKRLRRRICSAANRTMWRAALQRRAVNIAALMRTLPALVVPTEFSRVRTPDGWLVTVAGANGVATAVLEIVTRVGTRTFEQVRAVPVALVHSGTGRAGEAG